MRFHKTVLQPIKTSIKSLKSPLFTCHFPSHQSSIFSYTIVFHRPLYSSPLTLHTPLLSLLGPSSSLDLLLPLFYFTSLPLLPIHSFPSSPLILYISSPPTFPFIPAFISHPIPLPSFLSPSSSFSSYSSCPTCLPQIFSSTLLPYYHSHHYPYFLSLLLIYSPSLCLLPSPPPFPLLPLLRLYTENSLRV